MKNRIVYLFWICIGLYISVRLARLDFYEIPLWMNGYLADFVCMPIILTISLIGIRLIKKLPNFYLSPFMIFGMTTFYALFFEVYLPNISPKYTADYVDIIMYFVGAILFWKTQIQSQLSKSFHQQ